MARKGRAVELLIKHVQQQLVSGDIQVQSPEEFYVDGKKIAEVDITLRGKIGCTEIAIGIECRDRPSEGRQGLPWIRDINSKREQIDFHKFIAVSTTGFTPEAIKQAHKWNIDTIIISDLDKIDAKPLFREFRFEDELFYPKIIEQPQIAFEEGDPDADFAIKGTDKVFADSDGQLFDINDILKKHFMELPKKARDAEKLKFNVTAPYKVTSCGKTYNTKVIQFSVAIIRDKIQVIAVLNVCHDASGNAIATTGRCKIREVQGGELNVLITATALGEKATLTVAFYDSDWKPSTVSGKFTLTVPGPKSADVNSTNQ